MSNLINEAIHAARLSFPLTLADGYLTGDSNEPYVTINLRSRPDCYILLFDSSTELWRITQHSESGRYGRGTYYHYELAAFFRSEKMRFILAERE